MILLRAAVGWVTRIVVSLVIHSLCGDPASRLIMGSHQLPLPFGTPMVMMMILVRDGLPLLLALHSNKVRQKMDTIFRKKKTYTLF
jgi:hypothetical protein